MSLAVPSIKNSLKKFLPFLLQAQEQNLNEADTAQRLVKVFEEVLGYDPMAEISREALIKGKFVDFAVKINGAIKFLVEVKAAGIELRDRHTDQARAYAAEGNIPWVLLTNGTTWIFYHLTFTEGIELDRAFAISLMDEQNDEACACLGLLHRESIRKGLHEEYWQRRSALSAASLGRALFSEPIIGMIRRDIRKAQGISVDEDSLVFALKELFSAEAREQMGPIKIRRRRRKKIGNSSPSPDSSAAQPAVPDADSSREDKT